MSIFTCLGELYEGFLFLTLTIQFLEEHLKYLNNIGIVVPIIGKEIEKWTWGCLCLFHWYYVNIGFWEGTYSLPDFCCENVQGPT